MSRSSVDQNPFWSSRFAAALFVHCAAPVGWNDPTSVLIPARPPSSSAAHFCPALLPRFTPEASSSKWASVPPSLRILDRSKGEMPWLQNQTAFPTNAVWWQYNNKWALQYGLLVQFEQVSKAKINMSNPDNYKSLLKRHSSKDLKDTSCSACRIGFYSCNTAPNTNTIARDM